MPLSHRTTALCCRVLCALAALGAGTGAVHAQSIDPGLWEVNSRTKMPDNPDFDKQMAQLQQQLKNMPPEMRKEIEKSSGVSMVGGGSNAVRLCVTPEMAQAPERSAVQDGCTMQELSRSGKTVKSKLSCPSTRNHGEFTTTLHSKRHYATVAQLSGPQGRMEIHSEARYVGSDCGSLAGGPTKPPAAAKR